MMKLFFAVGLGGAIGSVLRYSATVLFTRWNYTSLPYATLIVNIAGCFLAGLFFSTSERYEWLSGNWRLFLITGFCGGLTTFSTFAYENFLLLQQGNYKTFFLYAVGSFAAGILAVIAGVNVVKLV